MARPFTSLAERLWAKVDKDGPVVRADLGPCWIWTARSRVRGYGYIQRGGRKGGRILAHRAAYELLVGPIPHGLDLLHRCDNPPCVNPSHLFPGSALDNSMDAHAKGRSYDTFTERPELVLGTANVNAKLDEKKVRLIRRRRAEGRSMYALAAEFGVSRQNIRFVVRGITWKEVV